MFVAHLSGLIWFQFGSDKAGRFVSPYSIGRYFSLSSVEQSQPKSYTRPFTLGDGFHAVYPD